MSDGDCPDAGASVDAATLGFYRRNAQQYAGWSKHRHRRLAQFLAQLPTPASVLELGCGAGGDTAYMLAQGIAVDPTDGSPEMAAEAARRLDHPVRTMLFHELDADAAYDGAWASACLLHVPRDQLAGVLSRIWRALRPGGYFYASFKAGDGEGRDRLDRYYNYPSPDWLRAQYAEAGDWASLAIETSEDKGYDNEPATILHVLARKQGDPE
ncbi:MULTISPECIES: class I SAM-dependent methyltransferase [Rhodopseudomonas]|uniref:SAM-dependent methyltransferase n=1 Tax=Rhodopseudomonas palustris TaxID=1076 RepID=A0A0D7EVB4_RHOPL|nr:MULTISPECIES: class I SAM-dependent methyltransferase [Rhodopseudomonas]KIZ44723.1 SAM-dependent methyltransferase [Rhodopseudomonas palustris]MDF3813483.1 class I SAM-dependent methyltransferase [Rhodopseudomonas sp. BAL398]WOK18689.1 class I SAM-dependent methyltransferase [Rhodopseudomonas sp. BAL398]